MTAHTRERLASTLARVAVFALLVLVGLGSIWLIDARAVQRMHEMEAFAALEETDQADRVEAIAEARLRQRYGDAAGQWVALSPMREDRLRWTVVFVPATGPGDPPPTREIEVHVDAATQRVQWLREHW